MQNLIRASLTSSRNSTTTTLARQFASDPNLKRTALYDFNKDHGAKSGPYAGYDHPVQYKAGLLKEHMAVRERAGLFDVSHMG